MERVGEFGELELAMWSRPSLETMKVLHTSYRKGEMNIDGTI
jgi:hypothetical protein